MSSVQHGASYSSTILGSQVRAGWHSRLSAASRGLRCRIERPKDGHCFVRHSELAKLLLVHCSASLLVGGPFASRLRSSDGARASQLRGLGAPARCAE